MISIIIPSYNAQDNINLCLKSIFTQELKCDFEVIVVDCSEHDEVEKICKTYNGINYIKRIERFNPGEGRNIGAQASKCALLMFLDADVILEKIAISNAWKFYQQGHKVFGGALELYSEDKCNITSYLEHYYFNHESQKNRPPCVRNNLSSALLCFDKELFIKHNGFKDIPRMQDTELTERVRSQGNQLFFSPVIVGYQIQDSPLSKVLRKVYITGTNLYLIRYKNKITLIRKVLFTLFLPLLSFLKISRIIVRNLQFNNNKGKVITFFLAPGLYFCGLLWALGFYKALLIDTEMSNER
jgi:glycosyltransferase involved in cell wall biosynthesis